MPLSTSPWHRRLRADVVAARVPVLWRSVHLAVSHWISQGKALEAAAAAAARQVMAQRVVAQRLRERDGRLRLHITLRRPSFGHRPTVPPSSAPPRRRLRVLLVEPKPAMRRKLTRILQHARIAVLPVREGRTAREMLQTALTAGVGFDVVIVDAWLRDPSSKQLVEELRALVPSLPILLLCSPRTSLPFGAVNHTTPVLPLVKPLAWAQIVNGLERAVRAVRPSDTVLEGPAVAESGGSADPAPALPAARADTHAGVAG